MRCKHYLFSILWLLHTVLACAQQKVAAGSPYSLYPGLFEDVQRSGIFSDSKTFVDCIPLKDPSFIMRVYNEQHKDSAFDLRHFVAQYFNTPAAVQAPVLPHEEIIPHIERLWEVLMRRPDTSAAGSLIGLPASYIVPGGRFREVYYWDSYFTMLGLKESGKTDLIAHMTDNFAWLIRQYGFIPNGNRTYYLTRSQPPYFSLMVRLRMQCDSSRAKTILQSYTGALEAEYRFWMAGSKARTDSAHVVHMPDGSLLNRYYDTGDWPREEAYTEDLKTAQSSSRPSPEVFRALGSGAESGWDFSSRWLSVKGDLASIYTTDLVPVDLNCLLYHLEQLLARAGRDRKDPETYRRYATAAASRKKAILKYCWNAGAGWFCDYDIRNRKQRPQLTLAGMYPLYSGIATPAQAQEAALLLEARFLRPGGLVTSLEHTGQQWDAPNGWAPLQWTAICGLRNYGHKLLADKIAKRWTRNNIRVFEQTGKLMEKYNVEDTTLHAGGGEYPTQDGFGWTNGVLLQLLRQQ